MSGASLRSEADAPSAVHGVAEVGFTAAGASTRLAHLHQRAPLRVLFPAPPPGDIPTAALVTTSGGLVGGDRLDIRAEAGPGARAQVHAQAAEKVYRSAGPDARVEVALHAADGAWLEWLPQETIVFDGARLRRRTVIHVAPAARLLAGEILVFGRHAHGEVLRRGLIREAWEVRADGVLVWADALHLDGDLRRVLDHPAGFGGAGAGATAVWWGEDRLETARRLLESADSRAAATVVNGVLVVRWLHAEAAVVRRDFGNFWAAFRDLAGGLPARLPRLWSV